MLIKDDCLNAMKALEEKSVDSLITDPPAGISFMGKEWDKGNNFIPAMTEIFKETLRVLKPGAHGLVWALPRTSHWTATALENAGFEIRDVITHLFGSGFPKSHNLGEGRGTALKPASEHWILIRKPISEKTVAANVLKHGVGGINIDQTRIKPSNRFPANLVLSHSENCEVSPHVFADGNTMAICADDCPVRMLDEQSGVLQSGGNSNKKSGYQNQYVGGTVERPVETFLDRGRGGASRFFYVAKCSKKDRGEDNNHPTVKATKLMEYLITLITPTGGIVLDPFMGSGSTGKAAKRLGFNFIGIEKEQEYFDIAEKRISA